MYSKKILDLFQHPKFAGEIKDSDGTGRVGNMRCGDIMEIYLKIEKKNGKGIIKDIKYKTFGCVAAIASTEALCAMIKGKTIDEALKIKKEDIVNFMGGEIPPIKVHCSVLASDALKKAVDDYKKKEN